MGQLSGHGLARLQSVLARAEFSSEAQVGKDPLLSHDFWQHSVPCRLLDAGLNFLLRVG